MSAVPRYPPEYGYAGLRMTADEYLALGETDERYELIEGVVVMSPSPTPLHSEIALEIIHQIKSFSGTGGNARVFAETDLRLHHGAVYRPDICAYRADRLPDRVERLTTPPDLVVEILSPGSKPLDLITKRDDYEKFGVREYWVLDPADARLRRWTRRADQLAEDPVTGESVASTGLPGFSLDLAPIRRLVDSSR